MSWILCYMKIRYRVHNRPLILIMLGNINPLKTALFKDPVRTAQ